MCSGSRGDEPGTVYWARSAGTVNAKLTPALNTRTLFPRLWRGSKGCRTRGRAGVVEVVCACLVGGGRADRLRNPNGSLSESGEATYCLCEPGFDHLLLLQETIDGLNSQLEAFQAKMKRVEESILSRDYKKHIQVGGRTPGAFSSGISREIKVWATGKAKPPSRTGIRHDILLFTRDWKKQGPRDTGAGEARLREARMG